MAGFHTVGPNEVLIISGGGKQPHIVVGGRAFVLPILQKAQVLSLEVMSLTVRTSNVYTKEGVAVSVDGVAQVKVARSEEAIRTAAQQFLGKNADAIAHIALLTMEGHQRAMLGTMTVEQLYQDRETLARIVREVASADMANMGLEIVSFTIKDIADLGGYLDALGVRRTSEVKRDAAVGEARAHRDSAIQKAEAERESEAARFKAQTQIAESQRDFNLAQAAYQKEVNRAKAETELAYKLQEAKTRQEIRQEELQIEVIERQQQILIQDEEIKRRERELDATIRRPAEAERFRMETLAEANKMRIRAEAEAEADAIKLKGEAEANLIRARGLAEAEAARAKGLAEAEAMEKKADAWKEYGQAAIVEQLIEALPQIVAAVAQPLSKTDRITVVSTGGDGAGASRVTRDVANTVAQVPELINALTGIDVLATIRNLPGVVSDGNGDAEAEGRMGRGTEAAPPRKLHS